MFKTVSAPAELSLPPHPKYLKHFHQWKEYDGLLEKKGQLRTSKERSTFRNKNQSSSGSQSQHTALQPHKLSLPRVTTASALHTSGTWGAGLHRGCLPLFRTGMVQLISWRPASFPPVHHSPTSLVWAVSKAGLASK